MERRRAVLGVTLVSGILAGAGMIAGAAAGETALRPEEAKRFVANKLFSYTCFDGTNGLGRIHADGSVAGTMQTRGGITRFVSLPPGTLRLTSEEICAALPHALIQPCFNVVQTSPHSFRGSVRGFGFAYCDFVRRNPRLDLARGEERPRAEESAARTVQSAIALRPSRY